MVMNFWFLFIDGGLDIYFNKLSCLIRFFFFNVIFSVKCKVVLLNKRKK